eukprot:7280695-Pyramimonas_sp.AAC.1
MSKFSKIRQISKLASQRPSAGSHPTVCADLTNAHVVPHRLEVDLGLAGAVLGGVEGGGHA